MDTKQTGFNESRRNLLTSMVAGVGSVAVTAPALALADTMSAPGDKAAYLTRGTRMESRFIFYPDPVEHQRAAFRILRSALDEADVLFWYHFTMFAVIPGRRPEPVVRWEGIEFSRHEKIAPNTFRVHGHNLSFPRDLTTGKWVTSATNPILQKQVEVPPLALTGDPGYVLTPKGRVPLDKPSAEPRVPQEQFLIEDDLVKIEQTRLPPATWPATFVETSTNSADRRLFEETDIPSIPCTTAGGYIFPFPEWMQMGDSPGHMFATWNGRKLGDVQQLPLEFITRAEGTYPDLLVVDKTPFEKPLPAELMRRITG
jgi:hypothetical protein